MFSNHPVRTAFALGLLSTLSFTSKSEMAHAGGEPTNNPIPVSGPIQPGSSQTEIWTRSAYYDLGSRPYLYHYMKYTIDNWGTRQAIVTDLNNARTSEDVLFHTGRLTAHDQKGVDILEKGFEVADARANGTVPAHSAWGIATTFVDELQALNLTRTYNAKMRTYEDEPLLKLPADQQVSQVSAEYAKLVNNNPDGLKIHDEYAKAHFSSSPKDQPQDIIKANKNLQFELVTRGLADQVNAQAKAIEDLRSQLGENSAEFKKALREQQESIQKLTDIVVGDITERAKALIKAQKAEEMKQTMSDLSAGLRAAGSIIGAIAGPEAAQAFGVASTLFMDIYKLAVMPFSLTNAFNLVTDLVSALFGIKSAEEQRFQAIMGKLEEIQKSIKGLQEYLTRRLDLIERKVDVILDRTQRILELELRLTYSVQQIRESILALSSDFSNWIKESRIRDAGDWSRAKALDSKKFNEALQELRVEASRIKNDPTYKTDPAVTEKIYRVFLLHALQGARGKIATSGEVAPAPSLEADISLLELRGIEHCSAALKQLLLRLLNTAPASDQRTAAISQIVGVTPISSAAATEGILAIVELLESIPGARDGVRQADLQLLSDLVRQSREYQEAVINPLAIEQIGALYHSRMNIFIAEVEKFLDSAEVHTELNCPALISLSRGSSQYKPLWMNKSVLGPAVDWRNYEFDSASTAQSILAAIEAELPWKSLDRNSALPGAGLVNELGSTKRFEGNVISPGEDNDQWKFAFNGLSAQKDPSWFDTNLMRFHPAGEQFFRANSPIPNLPGAANPIHFDSAKLSAKVERTYILRVQRPLPPNTRGPTVTIQYVVNGQAQSVVLPYREPTEMHPVYRYVLDLPFARLNKESESAGSFRIEAVVEPKILITNNPAFGPFPAWSKENSDSTFIGGGLALFFEPVGEHGQPIQDLYVQKLRSIANRMPAAPGWATFMAGADWLYAYRNDDVNKAARFALDQMAKSEALIATTTADLKPNVLSVKIEIGEAKLKTLNVTLDNGTSLDLAPHVIDPIPALFHPGVSISMTVNQPADWGTKEQPVEKYTREKQEAAMIVLLNKLRDPASDISKQLVELHRLNWLIRSLYSSTSPVLEFANPALFDAFAHHERCFLNYEGMLGAVMKAINYHQTAPDFIAQLKSRTAAAITAHKNGSIEIRDFIKRVLDQIDADVKKQKEVLGDQEPKVLRDNNGRILMPPVMSPAVALGLLIAVKQDK